MVETENERKADRTEVKHYVYENANERNVLKSRTKQGKRKLLRNKRSV